MNIFRNFVIHIIRDIVTLFKPIICLNEMFEPVFSIHQMVIGGMFVFGAKGGDGPKGLEVQELIVEHISALDIFISPVAGSR